MANNSKAENHARRIFLQDCKTKLLLSPANQWTADEAMALDFKYTLKAVSHALDHQLAQTQVLIRFEGTDLEDVVVPISSHARASHS